MSFISWQLSGEPGFLPQAQLGTGVLFTGQLWAGPRALGKVGPWLPEPAEKRLALPQHPVCRAGLSWPQECQSGLRGSELLPWYQGEAWGWAEGWRQGLWWVGGWREFPRGWVGGQPSPRPSWAARPAPPPLSRQGLPVTTLWSPPGPRGPACGPEPRPLSPSTRAASPGGPGPVLSLQQSSPLPTPHAPQQTTAPAPLPPSKATFFPHLSSLSQVSPRTRSQVPGGPGHHRDSSLHAAQPDFAALSSVAPTPTCCLQVQTQCLCSHALPGALGTAVTPLGSQPPPPAGLWAAYALPPQPGAGGRECLRAQGGVSGSRPRPWSSSEDSVPLLWPWTQPLALRRSPGAGSRALLHTQWTFRERHGQFVED